MVDQNDSITALSKLNVTRPIEPSRPAERSRWPKTQLVYYAPRSAWTIVLSGDRCQRAIARASTTSSERTWSAMDQPTTMRLQASMTAQQ